MTPSIPFSIKRALLIILAFAFFAMPSLPLSAEQPLLGNNSLSSALQQQPEFLPVDEAFQLSATHQDETVTLFWQIAPEYYLYKHRLRFEQPGAASSPASEIPAGKAKHDEYFGDVEVYYGSLSVTLSDLAAGAEGKPAALRVSYQGCADAGLCYPPQNRYLEFTGGNIRIASQSPDSGPAPSERSPITEEQEFTALLADAPLLKVLALFLAAGLALTFTPCVLPMVPIISSIVVGREQQPGRTRAFALSLTYVLAMAITYAMAGTITGYFGAELNLQMKLQSPWVLSAIALLFVLFALAMFGFYELRLPNALQSRLHNLSQQQQGGTYLSVAIIGILSSLIVSPCVSAPLAGALVYISSTGDPLLGGLALLALGLGMGIPLLLIGTFGADILPKAGQWMNQVKVFFGVLLLGVAIWMVERILPAPLVLAMFLVLLIGYAAYLKTFQAIFRFRFSGPAQLLGVALLGYSLLLLVGAGRGGYAPFAPIDNLNAGKHLASQAIMERFQPVTDLSDLDNQLAQAKAANKPVLLDIYADWCVSCRIIEQDVFPHPDVTDKLQQFTLLRADITKNSSADQALLQRFGLFGPPGLLFFSPSSGELRSHRIQGEINATQLSEHIGRVLRTNQSVDLAAN